MIVDIFIGIVTVVLIIQSCIGLSFFISCIWEKEKRASLFAGLQFLGMLAFLLFFLHLAMLQLRFPIHHKTLFLHYLLLVMHNKWLSQD